MKHQRNFQSTKDLTDYYECGFFHKFESCLEDSAYPA